MPTAAVLAVTAVAGAVAAKKSGDKAIKATTQAASTAAGQTTASANQARADVNRLFPQAQQTAQQGFQGALDVFGQSLPAQTDVFQQGNLGAQQAILSGLPQIQNALFGNQVDLGQLQPFQVQQPDLGFFNQTLPQFTPQDTVGFAQTGNPADMNAGLGQFDATNPAFNNVMGPFEFHSSPNRQSPILGGQNLGIDRGFGGFGINNSQVRR